MTLQQQIPANAPVSDRSGLFRLRSLFGEQQAQESTDPKSKQDWEELAIEWHMMASLAARISRPDMPISFGIADTPRLY
jgi:hypothetical protein